MKRALIVDDSRLARHVLSKLLSEHGVAAESAESAEAALDYLKSHRPDVIFLDHQMPGMDGFEALEAIKANPVTATIPVMMYTSKEGELYLGQARALGALGVLPKNVEPVEVTKVLRSLRLIPTSTDAHAGQPPPVASAPQPLDARQLRELLAELFYEQSAAWRDELARQVDKLKAANPAPVMPLPPVPVEPAPDSRRLRAYKLASAILLVTAALFGYLYYSTNALLREAHSRMSGLAAAATNLSLASTQALELPAPADAPTGVLEVLEAGFNRGGQFDFGAVPLDDGRAAMLRALLDELQRIDFAGTVAFEVHVGRFCMNYGVDGELELAPPDQSAATCDQVGWPELEAVVLGQRQSLDFAYVVARAEKERPELDVQTRSYGSTVPLVPYPSAGYEVSAGEWNGIAVQNQRVELALSPAAPDAR